MGRFEQRSDIFVDEDVLRDEYTPGHLIERDSEMNDYEEALQPIVNGSQPRNTFVYGETGVGKTLATRMILSELEADQETFDEVSVRTEWLSHCCKSGLESDSHQLVEPKVGGLSDSSIQHVA